MKFQDTRNQEKITERFPERRNTCQQRVRKRMTANFSAAILGAVRKWNVWKKIFLNWDVQDPLQLPKSAHAHVPYKKWCGVCIYAMHILLYTLNQRSPAFLVPGTGFVGDSFSMDRSGVGEGDGFRVIQVHYISWALHLYYYYISCTSDHQTLYRRGWGPLL